MGNRYKAPRGTADLLPFQSASVIEMENAARRISSLYGFSEIRTPTFESTELFDRSVGDTTDVVQKEMYTFDDNGGRSITLKPEGTAGCVRMFIEHGLFNEPAPQKYFYLTPCFRYEKPQAGRLREFHQFGVECFGAGDPYADAEMIELAGSFLKELGIEGVELKLNSIGCPECRATYQKALKEYFLKYEDDLCNTCRDRLSRNPMRILDCKSPECARISSGAPVITDYLCEDCREHFEKLKAILDLKGIEFLEDPSIVRGLDYYTRTVFEFVSGSIGAKSTVLGGGRYDCLVKELGGPDTPALGFAAGIERLMLLMPQRDGAKETERIFVASNSDKARIRASLLVSLLRSKGVACEFDTVSRSLKAQMKYAGKRKFDYVLVLGENELESGEIKLKRMSDGKETTYSLDNFACEFTSADNKA